MTEKKINADRFLVWEHHFTLDSDSQKDWLWELLFWDTKRRITVFSSLIAAILLSVFLFFLLAFGGCYNSGSSDPGNFSATVKAAHNGNAHAQFLLGKYFYFGESVKKDVDQALLWLTKSARAGHPQAAALLQKILVEQDIRGHEGQYLWKANDKNASGIGE